MRSLAIAATAVLLALTAGTALAAPRDGEAAAHDPVATSYGAFHLDPINPDVAYLDGAIEEHASDDFVSLVLDHPDVTLLILDSPGGLTEEARVISELIYALGIDTFIPDGAGCYSACSTIFFGGAQRVAIGELGVHRSYSDEAFENPEEISLLLGYTLESWMHYGLPLNAILATYRTPNEDIHVFTPDEIAGINRGTVGSLHGIDDELLARIALTSGLRYVALDDNFDVAGEFRGTLDWQLTGPADDPALVATIAIPDAGLEATVQIARVGDDGATQIDITFAPGDGPAVKYIERLSVDTSSGDIIDFIGSATAVSENTFRIVLPARWGERNDELLFDHSGFNLVFSYDNGTGGALLIDRLSAARELFAEAASAWGRTLPDPSAATRAVLTLPPDPPKVENPVVADGTATWSFDVATNQAVVIFQFPGEDFWSRALIGLTGDGIKVLAADRSYPDGLPHGGLVALDGLTIRATSDGPPLAFPGVMAGRGLSLQFAGADISTVLAAGWLELAFANADGSVTTIAAELGDAALAVLSMLSGEHADAP